MTTTDSPTRANTPTEIEPPPEPELSAGVGRVAPMRGGGTVSVDSRRLTRVVGIGAVAVTAIVICALFVVGARKNAQIDQLRSQGVPVQVTVTSCQGLLGGSGSNAAGYSCRGSFALAGRQYTERIPGNSKYVPGTTLSAVAVPDDPALISTTSALEGEHASTGVYLVPVALLVMLMVTVGVFSVRRRTARSSPHADG
jgi:hypothetical protein